MLSTAVYLKQERSLRSKLSCATLLHNKPRWIACNLSKNENCGLFSRWFRDTPSFIAAIRNTIAIARRLLNEFNLWYSLFIEQRNNGAFTVSGSEADFAFVAIDRFDHPFNLVFPASACRSLQCGSFARDTKVMIP